MKSALQVYKPWYEGLVLICPKWEQCIGVLFRNTKSTASHFSPPDTYDYLTYENATLRNHIIKPSLAIIHIAFFTSGIKI